MRGRAALAIAAVLGLILCAPAGGRALAQTPPGTGWLIRLVFTPQAGLNSTGLSCGWHSGACGATLGPALDFPADSSDMYDDVYFRVFGVIPSGVDQWIGWAQPFTVVGTTCKTTRVEIYDRNQNALASMFYTHTYLTSTSTMNIWVAPNGRLNQTPFAEMAKAPPPSPTPVPADAENRECAYHQPDPYWTGVHLHEQHADVSNTTFLRDGGDCTQTPPDRYPCGEQAWPYPTYNPQNYNDWTRTFCISDWDCDGWTDTNESYIGTDPHDDCRDDGNDNAWPPDIDNNAWVNTLDMMAFKPHLNCHLGQACYSKRYDLAGSTPGVPDGAINVLDMIAIKPYLNKRCT